MQHLLSNPDKAPKTLFWVSKRSNFLPLDESPFTNELFTPNYSDYFYGLSAQDRVSLLAEQKFASDGISNSLLERIYQLLYQAVIITKSREEDRLERDDHRQQAVRLSLDAEHDPAAEPADVDVHERHRAGEGRDPIRNPVLDALRTLPGVTDERRVRLGRAQTALEPCRVHGQAAFSGGGTISTVRDACVATSCETLPASSRRPLRPRDPITISVASS